MSAVGKPAQLATEPLGVHGFNVRRFQDGIPEWNATDFPMEAMA
jgi:hypothetical protein